jgi:hypothetical protein
MYYFNFPVVEENIEHLDPVEEKEEKLGLINEENENISLIQKIKKIYSKNELHFTNIMFFIYLTCTKIYNK